LFFTDTPTTEIYTLSLHDALPISSVSLLIGILQPVCPVGKSAGCDSLNGLLIRRPRTAFGPSHREGLRSGNRLQGRDQESRKVGGDGLKRSLALLKTTLF